MRVMESLICGNVRKLLTGDTRMSGMSRGLACLFITDCSVFVIKKLLTPVKNEWRSVSASSASWREGGREREVY